MNLNEIRRNLNRNIAQPPQQVEPPKIENEHKPDLINSMYDDDSEEEKPESEVWETKKESIDIYKPVSNIINELELENNKFDWRYKTKKGKKSRKNFSNLLKDSIE